MFHKLITYNRDAWFSSPECTVKGLVDYIQTRGQMRDAQVEAIKTYLYLKIACRNAPLWRLFSEGTFNSLDIDAIPLSAPAREVLSRHKAAVALLEYARLKDRNGRQIAPS